METASIVIKIITYLPDGTREEYRFGDMYKRCKKLANALTKKVELITETWWVLCMESYHM
jgi:hypothetical protein